MRLFITRKIRKFEAKAAWGVMIYRFADANVWFEHPTVFMKLWKNEIFVIFLISYFLRMLKNELRDRGNYEEGLRVFQAETWLTVSHLLRVEKVMEMSKQSTKT